MKRWAVLFALLATAGCTTTEAGSPAADGPAATPTSSVGSVAFDPCTAITDQQLQGLGLVPSTKEPYGGGPGQADETGCSWSAGGEFPDYGISFGVSARNLDEYRTNPLFTVADTTISGRPALDFTRNPSGPECNLAITIAGGLAVVAVVPNGTEFQRDRSCPVAQSAAEAIAPVLP